MRYVNYLGYAALPLAFLVHYVIGHDKSWEPTVTFLLAALAVIPLAHLMGEATEHLAERTGPTWGGLLNATFGNAAELIIAVIAISKGLNSIVMASLTGSILGNLLLVAGAAMVVGGWNREKQVFSKEAAEANAGLLVVAVAAMLFPAIFDFTFRASDPHFREHEHGISVGTSVILLAVYGLGLLFTLRTHSHLFSPKPAESPEEPAGLSGVHHGWSVKKSVIALLLASAGIGVVAELLVGSADTMAKNLGWNHIFVGVILLAIIGNAAEHSTALLLARRNDMDTAMTIAFQSSIQIALFATPFLVLVSILMLRLGLIHPEKGVVPQPLDLIFSPMEVAAVLLTVLIVVVVSLNGQSNWFEGVLLLAVYCILGITFFYIPEAAGGGYDVHPAAATGPSAP
jgi:Ca2+:H+ antiporter